MADPSHSSPTADSLLAPAVGSDAPEPAALPAAAPDLDAEFGFHRPELGKEKLAGTVGFRQRHVFLCYKGPAPRRGSPTATPAPPPADPSVTLREVAALRKTTSGVQISLETSIDAVTLAANFLIPVLPHNQIDN